MISVHTLKQMPKEFLVHLQNTKVPTLSGACLLVCQMTEQPPRRQGSIETVQGVVLRFGGLLLHSLEGRRAFVCSSVSPSIKWEEARLPPQKLPVTRSGSARDPFFPLPVSPWHCSEWWPAVAMVTQHRVTLLRNNDNWRQRGSRAQWWLASKECSVWAERSRRRKDGFNKSWADATSLQQLAVVSPDNAWPQRAGCFYRISPWLPDLSIFLYYSEPQVVSTVSICCPFRF